MAELAMLRTNLKKLKPVEYQQFRDYSLKLKVPGVNYPSF